MSRKKLRKSLKDPNTVQTTERAARRPPTCFLPSAVA
jgi:hypothetical protein